MGGNERDGIERKALKGWTGGTGERWKDGLKPNVSKGPCRDALHSTYLLHATEKSDMIDMQAEDLCYPQNDHKVTEEATVASWKIF